MMKLSSSWPSGRMLFESDSGVTSRASFSAEFSGGRAAADFTDGEDWIIADWIITSMSRAISSPEGSTGASKRGGGTNSILGWGVNELTDAVAVIIGSGTGGGGGSGAGT